jgi:hypothetical protein
MIQHFILSVHILPTLCKVVALLLQQLFEILPGEVNHVLRPLPDDLLGVPLEDPWQVWADCNLFRIENAHLSDVGHVSSSSYLNLNGFISIT